METRSGKIIDLLVEVKNPPGKRPFKVHTVKLDNGEQIEVGYKQPYTVGQMFNSEVEFKYGKYKEVKPLAGAPSTSSATSTPVAATPMAFPIPKANKETAIIRQNALTNAVNAVNQMQSLGLTSHKTADEIANEVISLAYKFAEFSSGQREVRLTKELVGDED